MRLQLLLGWERGCCMTSNFESPETRSHQKSVNFALHQHGCLSDRLLVRVAIGMLQNDLSCCVLCVQVPVGYLCLVARLLDILSGYLVWVLFLISFISNCPCLPVATRFFFNRLHQRSTVVTPLTIAYYTRIDSSALVTSFASPHTIEREV